MANVTPKRVLITGANRGIGLELAAVHIEAGDRVWGSTRAGRDERLRSIDPAGTVTLDLSDEDSIVAGMAKLAAGVDGLDLLVNCAGIDARALGATDGARGPFELDAATLLEVTMVNAAGPMVVTREALPLLLAGRNPMVVNVSSQLGSMSFAARAGSDTAYCVSKAALNMLTVKTAAALRSRRIGVVTIHPGWVSTDMGGPRATLTPRQSAEAVHETVTRLTMADSGRFLTWDGRDHPW